TWQYHPQPAHLTAFTAHHYTPLARNHGLDPWDATSAAFDVMPTRAGRAPDDPCALMTPALRLTCLFQARPQRPLRPVQQARSAHISAFHDPERFSDRETPLTDYHSAFHIPAADAPDAPDQTPASARASTTAGSAVEDAIALFTLLDWPADIARAAVEHVCAALTRAGTRQAAYEALRRDKHARALLDIPGRSWTALLKALLGHPHPAYTATGTGRGVLLRLLIGESLPVLLRDDDLVLSISLAAPTHHYRGERGLAGEASPGGESR